METSSMVAEDMSATIAEYGWDATGCGDRLLAVVDMEANGRYKPCIKKSL